MSPPLESQSRAFQQEARLLARPWKGGTSYFVEAETLHLLHPFLLWMKKWRRREVVSKNKRAIPHFFTSLYQLWGGKVQQRAELLSNLQSCCTASLGLPFSFWVCACCSAQCLLLALFQHSWEDILAVVGQATSGFTSSPLDPNRCCMSNVLMLGLRLLSDSTIYLQSTEA